MNEYFVVYHDYGGHRWTTFTDEERSYREIPITARIDRFKVKARNKIEAIRKAKGLYADKHRELPR